MRTRILKFANFIVFGEVPCVAGLLFSTYSLAQVIALPLLGRLADHIGRRPVPLSFSKKKNTSLASGWCSPCLVLLLVPFYKAQSYAKRALTPGMAPTLGILFLGRIVSGFCGAVGAVRLEDFSSLARQHCQRLHLRCCVRGLPPRAWSPK